MKRILAITIIIASRAYLQHLPEDGGKKAENFDSSKRGDGPKKKNINIERSGGFIRPKLGERRFIRTRYRDAV